MVKLAGGVLRGIGVAVCLGIVNQMKAQTVTITNQADATWGVRVITDKNYSIQFSDGEKVVPAVTTEIPGVLSEKYAIWEIMGKKTATLSFRSRYHGRKFTTSISLIDSNNNARDIVFTFDGKGGDLSNPTYGKNPEKPMAEAKIIGENMNDGTTEWVNSKLAIVIKAANYPLAR